MKSVMICLFCKLPSIVCFAGATYIMSLGGSGWGWLIFAGILVSTNFISKDE